MPYEAGCNIRTAGLSLRSDANSPFIRHFTPEYLLFKMQILYTPAPNMSIERGDLL